MVSSAPKSQISKRQNRLSKSHATVKFMGNGSPFKITTTIKTNQVIRTQTIEN